MSDVQSRPSASRGRSSARGGRGGYSSRGPRSKQVNGHNGAGSIDASTEEGELGELRQQYEIQLKTIKDTFPDWTDLDLLLALHDSDGDLQLTSERILEGQISQFADVPKKSDRSRSKIKDSTAADTAPSTAPTRSRGQSSRGGRGRGAERGRGGFRGRGGAHAPNGSRNVTGGGASVPTNESSAWDATPSADAQGTAAWDKPIATETKDGAAEGQWNNATTSEATPAAASEGAKNTSAPEPPKKTWASMFAKPKPAPAPAPPKPAAAAPPPEPAVPAPAPVQEEPEPVKEETPPAAQTEELPIPPVADEAPAAEPVQPAVEPPVAIPAVAEPTPAANLSPPKEELTEDNVERIPDASVPAPTGTAASTVASGSAVGVATPLTGPKGGAGSRPPMGGFQTSALKATGAPGRSSSFQRKVVEQQEAVVMPGNHAVDRAAVQFGSMGLNGEPDLDVDEDREEAETRTQPPQHSPTQQPRTSLPPAPRQPSGPTEPQIQDSVPTPKQAPGLPPPVAQAQQPIAPQQQSPAVGTQAAQPYSQFGRYGQPVMHSEPAAQTQKPYDPFGAPVSQPSQFDAFPTSQAQTMPQAQASLGAFSTAPNDYSSYYTSDQRNAYQNYYGTGYGQQAGGSQQEADASQRAGSAFGPTTGEAAFPTTQSQQAPARYGDAHNSGQNTPAPTMAAHHTAAAQSQHLNQPHGHAGHNAGFPYGGPAHPYYSSPYYANYMSQYGGGYGQNYGAPFGGKGMYAGAHHGYGMSPATTYDTHAASPANVGGFGASSMHARDNALGAGLGDYGRSNSTQPAQAQQHTASSGAFGGMPDVFARNQSMFPGQNQAYGQQQPGSQAGNDDALKPFGEKTAPGPSPSSIGQPGRPGSATNNSVGQGAQTGLPPPQSHQQGFGGYPASQYGLSGLGGAHQGGQSYGGYGGFGAGYGGYSTRGGWGGNYGGH